ncbi:MAG TPA: hypothetical protein VLL03_01445 [Burkholderiales bacterium]|nr:hypothetical protein [Burkholderiales bacterium]
MHCHLLIPALLKPAASTNGLYENLSAPALRTLLARATPARELEADMESWLCHAFGAEKQQDWPVAALALAADGINPGAAYWLRADPVNLQVDRGQLLLMDSRAFPIAQDEADQFIRVLNSQFADRGYVFQAPHPQRWYLRLDKAPNLQTSPLDRVVGKNVDDFLAMGADGLHWQGVCNEAQMLLHEHPLNEVREASGELPINGIWLWGGGHLPMLSRKPFTQVWADGHLPRSLALASAIPWASLPRDAEKWLEQMPVQDEPLIVLDQLLSAALYHDSERWRSGVKELEISWFAPLLAALKSGRVAAIIIVADGSSFSIMRKDSWKWWRRSRPFAEYTH